MLRSIPALVNLNNPGAGAVARRGRPSAGARSTGAKRWRAANTHPGKRGKSTKDPHRTRGQCGENMEAFYRKHPEMW